MTTFDLLQKQFSEGAVDSPGLQYVLLAWPESEPKPVLPDDPLGFPYKSEGNTLCHSWWDIPRKRYQTGWAIHSWVMVGRNSSTNRFPGYNLFAETAQAGGKLLTGINYPCSWSAENPVQRWLLTVVDFLKPERIWWKVINKKVYLEEPATKEQPYLICIENIFRDSAELCAELRAQDATKPPQEDDLPQTTNSFSFVSGQALYDGKDLKLPAGYTISVLQILVAQIERVVGFQTLDEGSLRYGASEQLKKAITTIRKSLTFNKIHFYVSMKRSESYLLTASQPATLCSH